MSRSWADGVAPAGVEVACEGEIHQLLWRAGELLAPAHPDLEAARALAGLGGAPCRCLELLDAWDACSRDPRVLVVGPRGSDAVPAWPDSPGRRARLARSVKADPLTAILSLGDQLPRRLVATVADRIADEPIHPALFPMVHNAVFARVRNAVHRWQRRTLPEVVLELIPGGAPRSLSGSPDTSIVARLPLRWLTDVWAPDLDVVSGQFTLAARSVQSPDGIEWQLQTVDAAMRPQTEWFMAT